MKFVLFSDGAGQRRPGVLGVLGASGVHEIGADLLPERDSPNAIRHLIDRYDSIRSPLEALASKSGGRGLDELTLHAPLPERGKMLCALSNSRPGVGEAAPVVFVFVKGGSAVAGPGVTIELPNLGGREVFTADASVGLVMKGPAYCVSAADWQSAVFGYTGVLDVTARTIGMVRWAPGTCIGAACDAFAPTGPVLVTADEIPDPAAIRVRQWNNGELVQDYALGDMIHGPGALIETTTRVMTLYSGDVIACGGDPAGQGPIAQNDKVAMEVAGVGRLEVSVSDPLGRSPDKSWRVGDKIGRDCSFEVLRDRAKILAENAL